VEGAEGAEVTTHATSSSRATAPEEAIVASPMRAVEAEVEEEETIIKVSRANLPSPYIQCIG
jgi:predicted RNase H-like nuclease (RuvC/YqgF family)